MSCEAGCSNMYDTQHSTDCTLDASTGSVFVVPGPATSTPKSKRSLIQSFDDTAEVSNTTSESRSVSDTDMVYVECATSPLKKATLRLLEDVTLPLTQEEERYFTRIAKLKMENSDDRMTVVCKTGGQPIILKKIIKARKPSAMASSPLRRKRTTLMGKIRSDLSGGTEKDQLKQQASELKKTRKNRQDKVLEEAGIKKTGYLSGTEALAMRTTVGMSWTQHRMQARLLKAVGVKIESEHKQREIQKKLQLSDIETERKVMITDSGRMQAPVTHVRSIPDLVTNVLDQCDDNGSLTWHDGAIPADEVWVKLGGDHGGGTFKLMMQVSNLPNPNSKNNTFLLAIVNTKDSPENIRTILNPFKTQVDNLQGLKWRGRKIRVFMFGDYDYLLKMYGISGAQSTHPCLWCKASKEQTQVPRPQQQPNIPKRSVTNIRADYRKYLGAGKDKKKAKAFNNVTHLPVWDIDLSQVAPPYLHLLLGIVKKHHVLLEKECHKLDMKLGESLAQNCEKFDNDSLFGKFVKQCKEISNEEQKKMLVEGQAVFQDPEDFQSLADYVSEHRMLMGEIEDLDIELDEKKEEKHLPLLSGPVTANLDEVLKQNNISVQAYHGRSFVGNHCHKYLKPAVYSNICDSVVSKTKELTDDARLHALAEKICSTFKELNSLFSEVHGCVSHTLSLKSTNTDPQDVQGLIDRYMNFYRKNFPSHSVLPKQHILEYHCVDFMDRWGFALGLHGEQGGEETHAVVNRLKRRAWGLRCEKDKLELIMREHMALVSPVLQSTVTTLHAKRLKKK